MSDRLKKPVVKLEGDNYFQTVATFFPNSVIIRVTGEGEEEFVDVSREGLAKLVTAARLNGWVL